MKCEIKNILTSVAAASMLVAGLSVANADGDRHHRDYDDQECPVGTPYGADSFTTMFGPEVEATLRCNKKREGVRLVVQVNEYCRDSHDSTGAPIKPTTCAATRAFALGNMQNMINDYKKTHGMDDDDFKMVAIVHSAGGHLVRKNIGPGIPNPWAAQMQSLMDQGVKFYFCLNTGAGFIKNGAFKKYGDSGIPLQDQMVPGVRFVPAGLNAIADFQAQGYTYVQP